ncbi:folylpolyglutamate synthase [Roseibium sp. TrichSKD4]|uniref:bifunctional folylpolyglutamate synthase/dihydrofolate synthase n=1 Tax=Roseibium sp. TrichSKD4 TaxID=744980 RepID=UPI0001E56F98|nr:folylpolyglutamate synthase/dihydrofolate synthase family protein [Roseibium sp. TrichSKD4]EFO32257.1 folylpolyglutamate synthase [Roseibium sp. TrichSKD4]
MDQVSEILDRLLSLHPSEIDLTLERMERLLLALGSPEKSLPPVIHIAGTNGKGSVTAIMRALLEAGGKRCHVYTSPHLVKFNERIRLGTDGQIVSDEKLKDALLRCETANAGEEITFFEVTTAAALLLFSENPADVVLLEVGLGGRLDATNVIENPAACVITPVSMDHQDYLGPTLAGIALEKAGILKPACPAVIGPQQDEALPIMEMAVARLRIPLKLYGQDYMAYADQGRLAFQDEDGLFDLPLPNLVGAHQVSNAAMAIAALKAAGFWPGEEAAAKALRSIEWPGRLQSLTSGRVLDLLPEGAEVWLDGGHNPDAAVSISAFMGDREEQSPKPLYLVSGMLNTKDPVGYFRPYEGLARHVATVPIRSSSNGVDPLLLADHARTAGLEATPFPSLDDAFADIRSCAERDGESPRVLICGSLYLAGDILKMNDMPPR